MNNDELNQKISQLLDDDLSAGEAFSILKKMRHDAQAEATWRRYATMGYALKSQQWVIPEGRFVDRVSNALANEPIYFLPPVKKEHQKERQLSFNWFDRRLLAFAASVVAVTVWVIHYWHSTENSPEAVFRAAKENNQQTTASAAKDNEHRPEPSSLNARISDYLQAHSGTYASNMPDQFQSITRTAVYPQQ